MQQPSVSYLDCPAWLDDHGHRRCGLPAQVEARYLMDSTDGPLESAIISCPLGHRFNGPIEFLTVPASARARDSHLAASPAGPPPGRSRRS